MSTIWHRHCLSPNWRCDTKIHCTVDFFNVGGLIVSVVIFDTNQKTLLHTFHSKSLLHRAAYFCTNSLLHHKVFAPKKQFSSVYTRIFLHQIPFEQKHSPHVSTELHKQSILKVHCPKLCLYCKKIAHESPKTGSPNCFLSQREQLPQIGGDVMRSCHL